MDLCQWMRPARLSEAPHYINVACLYIKVDWIFLCCYLQVQQGCLCISKGVFKRDLTPSGPIGNQGACLPPASR